MQVTQLWVFFSLFGLATLQSNTDVQSLLTQLFTTNNYNTLIRPSTNQSEPKEIDISFNLYGITDVDEIEQKLTTTGWLVITWQDDLLTWTPASYNGVEKIYLPQGNIWKPDVSLQNGFNELEELGSKFIQVYVHNSGLMMWRPFQVFETKCDMNSRYFPFDEQKCQLVFVSWSHASDDITLIQSSNGIDLSDELDGHGEWEIISSSATSELDGFISRVKFTIVIKRKPLYTIMNIVLPIILLALLDIFTFKIPADTGERLGYTITVWLSFAVFLTIVSDSLPKTSDSVPIVSIYIIIQLLMGTLIVLISTVEAGLVANQESVPVYSILRFIALRLRRNNVKSSEDMVMKIDLEKSEVTWKEAITALDTCFFLICMGIFFITTIICFLIVAI
ncbi:neuronal acetylcholine receptor subunit beta-2-like [Mytilus trossulus]|uniref:neuronal acetylcholine receptor subunit beta-2-like n=1 Tax=Mytilus trossulus TaxID=6551 RepID=UPI00300745E7